MRPPGFLLLTLTLLIAGLAGGCNSPGEPAFRAGSLPFPGLYLFSRADPQRLGTHRYWSPLRWGDGEVSRGIIYTQRAGFVDVAHIRDTADWTRYYATRVEPALRRGEEELELGGPDGTRVYLRFDYPEAWAGLPTFEREQLIHELALRCGQEAGYAVLTWHEVITWFGHQTIPFVSEAPSSFTYDDVMSHVIGLNVAERAWSDHEREYNDAVTAALDEELHSLGAGTPQETARAVDTIRGWWWQRGKALKRHLDVGLDDGVVEPMRIEDFQMATAAPSAESAGRFRLPRASDVAAPGLDFSDFLAIELESHSQANARLREYMPRRPLRVVPERDIPVLVSEIRREMQVRIGPAVDTLADAPTPTAAAVPARGTLEKRAMR